MPFLLSQGEPGRSGLVSEDPYSDERDLTGLPIKLITRFFTGLLAGSLSMNRPLESRRIYFFPSKAASICFSFGDVGTLAIYLLRARVNLFP